MNNELKYALNAVLLAVLFFASIQFASFILSKEETATQKPVNKNTDVNSIISTLKESPKFLKGKALFSNNCVSCHALNKTDNPPDLGEIEKRVPDKQLLYSFIRNSQQVIESGNEYFNDMYNAYNKTAMNSFPNLTDEDIEAILFYIKIQSNAKLLPIASVKAGSF